jgi:hypothetical protein
MAFLNDTFTDTDSTELSAHTGETGATWTEHPDSAASQLQIKNNRVGLLAHGFRELYYASGSPTGSEYDVSFDLYVIDETAGYEVGIVIEMNTGAGLGGYAIIYQGSSDDWRLVRYDNGSAAALLAEYDQVLASSTTYSVAVRFRTSGNTIEVDIGGTTRLTSTDSTYTGVGRIGLIVKVDEDYMQIDNLVGTDAGASVSPTTFLYYSQMLRN